MNNWISVKDRLPDYGKVLVCWTRNPAGNGENDTTTAECKPQHEITISYYLPGQLTRDGIDAFSSVKVGYTITHWMSLPEPPKDNLAGE